jgi:hypothetical protein
MAEKLENAHTRRGKKKPPSLRRHYPVQVLRVLSQPIFLPACGGEGFSTPGTLENRFSAGNTKICNRELFFTSNKKNADATSVGLKCLLINHLSKNYLI